MPPFTDKDLKKFISSGKFQNLYLLYGEEKYLISVYEKRLVDKILTEGISSFNYMLFDGDQPDFYAISTALDSFPIMSQKKCVVVRNLNLEILKKEEIQLLEDIISDIPEFSVLIISQTSVQMDLKKSPKWNKFIKSVSKYGAAFVFDKSSKTSLTKQLIKWAKSLNKSLSEKNAELIVQRCGPEFNVLRNELEKVCALEQKEEINEQTIKNITTVNLETDVFELCKEIMQGNYTKAVKHMDLLLSDKQEPIAILAVIASNFIDMYRVRTAIEGGIRTSEIPKFFDYKGKEFKIKIAEKNSRFMSTENIRCVLQLLANADFRLKDSDAKPRVIMDELLVKIMKLRDNRGST